MSLSHQQQQEETNRMANIMARGSDREVIEDQTPTVNVTNQDAGATSEMRDALAQMPGGNSKADYLDKWNQVADVRLSGKKQLDNRTEWEKDKDKAAELRDRDWKANYISRTNKNRDGYEANIPVFRDGKLYSKHTGKLWTDADWKWLHTKYGQPVHYNSEAKGV